MIKVFREEYTENDRAIFSLKVYLFNKLIYSNIGKTNNKEIIGSLNYEPRKVIKGFSNED